MLIDRKKYVTMGGERKKEKGMNVESRKMENDGAFHLEKRRTDRQPQCVE